MGIHRKPPPWTISDHNLPSRRRSQPSANRALTAMAAARRTGATGSSWFKVGEWYRQTQRSAVDWPPCSMSLTRSNWGQAATLTPTTATIMGWSSTRLGRWSMREFDSRRTTMKNYMTQLAHQGLVSAEVKVHPAMAAGLPGNVCRDINETFLLSGTKPEHLLAILHNGLNPTLSARSGAFGAGVYLAEEAAKIDQYTTPDSSYEQDQLDELHARLFRPSWPKHPEEDLFYCIVVRTVLGHPVFTKDAVKSLNDNGGAVFHDEDRRELVQVPGSSPPVRYSSLIAEKGEAIKRFREFVIFTRSQMYVEYIVAFKRV
ncbi:unnamed protein product [Polarella glacialis]|uniref:PARP catalytic domain-containing protein n=1 Tax=Polarella glacialis TaxID=89957 RepID=A0A813EQ27_POLGL|nr:unnamed protein product [Polarella glacialis]CAE8628863.1 unnamed protein product [Polarella glacialis]CAE8646914.1 unnamed protein product [Polarella glacialis]